MNIVLSFFLVFNTNCPGDTLTYEKLESVDYLINGVNGTIGGLGGFYITLALSTALYTKFVKEDISSDSYITSTGALGYIVGMPLGVSCGLHFGPKRKGIKGSFKTAFLGAAQGVQMGIFFLFFANKFLQKERVFLLPVIPVAPIVMGVTGYNRSIKNSSEEWEQGFDMKKIKFLVLKIDIK